MDEKFTCMISQQLQISSARPDFVHGSNMFCKIHLPGSILTTAELPALFSFFMFHVRSFTNCLWRFSFSTEKSRFYGCKTTDFPPFYGNRTKSVTYFSMNDYYYLALY